MLPRLSTLVASRAALATATRRSLLPAFTTATRHYAVGKTALSAENVRTLETLLCSLFACDTPQPRCVLLILNRHHFNNVGCRCQDRCQTSRVASWRWFEENRDSAQEGMYNWIFYFSSDFWSRVLQLFPSPRIRGPQSAYIRSLSLSLSGRTLAGKK